MKTINELEAELRKEERRQQKKQMHRLRRLLVPAALLLFAAALLLAAGGKLRRKRLEVRGELPADAGAVFTVLDVGQGSALLIESEGEAMLVDGGGRKSSSKVVAVLKKRGISRLKYLAVTHYDEDHLAGLIGALEAVGAECVLAPDYRSDTAIYASFMQRLQKKEVPVLYPAPGESFILGKLSFTVLAPCRNDYEKENNRSLALRFTDGKSSLLVTGDAEAESEADMLSAYGGAGGLRSDIYVVSHHGSGNASTAEFLRAVHPEALIISCGRDNAYGHPHKAAMARLKDTGAVLFRTDLQEDIGFAFTRNGIVWNKAPTDDWSAGAGKE